MPDDRRTLTLDRNVLLPVGAVVATLGSAMWLSWQAATRLSSIDTRLERIEDAIDSNARVYEMQAWIDLFKAANPTLAVPDYPRRQP